MEKLTGWESRVLMAIWYATQGGSKGDLTRAKIEALISGERRNHIVSYAAVLSELGLGSHFPKDAIRRTATNLGLFLGPDDENNILLNKRCFEYFKVLCGETQDQEDPEDKPYIAVIESVDAKSRLPIWDVKLFGFAGTSKLVTSGYLTHSNIIKIADEWASLTRFPIRHFKEVTAQVTTLEEIK